MAGVFTAEAITVRDLKVVVAEFGGEWVDHHGLNHGFIERDGGAMELFLDNEEIWRWSDENITDADRADIYWDGLPWPDGFVPVSFVVADRRSSLDDNRQRAARCLQQEVLEMIAARWKGHVVWLDPPS